MNCSWDEMTYVFHTVRHGNLEDTRIVRSHDHTGAHVYSHMIVHRACQKSQQGILEYGTISCRISCSEMQKTWLILTVKMISLSLTVLAGRTVVSRRARAASRKAITCSVILTHTLLLTVHTIVTWDTSYHMHTKVFRWIYHPVTKIECILN